MVLQVSSSIGRALVSKTRGCGFDSCLTCYEGSRLQVYRIGLMIGEADDV